jgi:hypothetical protein
VDAAPACRSSRRCRLIRVASITNLGNVAGFDARIIEPFGDRLTSQDDASARLIITRRPSSMRRSQPFQTEIEPCPAG